MKLAAAADFLSHLTEKEQSCLLLVMEQDEAIPSMAQARQMKELSQEGKLEQDQIERIMREEKPLEHKITLDGKWAVSYTHLRNAGSKTAILKGP